jgi:hypothetical protein
MRRFLLLIVPTLCAAGLHGAPIGGPIQGACGSTTATLMVNSTPYSLAMEGTPTSCFIGGTFGTFGTTGYTITVTATTQSDPVIDFGMNFSGDGSDPLVTLQISTPYIGGPYLSLFATGSGTLTNSGTTGAASVLPQSGSDIETVLVNGIPLVTGSPLNPGCSFSGEPQGFVQNGCGPLTTMQINGPFPSTGTLEVDAVFNLSATGSYNVSGSASFTPEPASGVLLSAGLLAMLGLARRRLLN